MDQDVKKILASGMLARLCASDGLRLILGRPLFTDSLMLTELAAAAETRRVQLVVGWWMKGLAELEGIVAREARRSATTRQTSLR